MNNEPLSSALVDKFISEQKAEWPLAASNFDALAGVKVKEVALPGWTIKVQFNPARIVSSGAKVDAKSIKERKCFLCHENRPDVQRGIDWDKYTVLINPFPIFPRHLTIPDRSHTDQLIAGRIADMISLAEALDQYTVFYNGPRCGASAPDHMHFQAGNSDFLTLATALEDADFKTIATEGQAVLALVDTLPLNVFVIDTDNPADGQKLFDRLYAAMPIPQGENEPMMNILCYATPAGVRIVVIPRKRHRPSFYGTEGPDTMLLSPASVDMGGVFITPLEKDFNALNADIILRIFDELCLSDAEINNIAQNIQ
jgi:ATP adenylyltransferase/5',5'''-P-1,P-4-tetraphosphate phosphorylase II